MENKKGNGIFLGIVSVATLVVAIIGATFAYFSATTSSNEDAVNLTAYEFKLTLSVEPVFPDGASSLIPLKADEHINEDDSNPTYLDYALNSATNGCIDDNELQVCALYKVTIRNQGTNPITLGGQIRTVTNTPGSGGEGFKNLQYQSVSVSPDVTDIPTLRAERGIGILNEGDEITDSILAVGTKGISPNVDDKVEIDSIYVPAATSESEPGIGVGYVLVYLADNEDQSEEMGASFTGQLIYASKEDGGETTLTGTFNLAMGD